MSRSVVPDLTAERAARNEASFRRSNEQLESFSDELGFDPDELRPFLCECAEPTCTTVVQLTGAEYEQVRRNPVRFAYAPGHEGAAGGWGRVIDEFARYSVVEKVGEAAEIVEALDERSER